MRGAFGRCAEFAYWFFHFVLTTIENQRKLALQMATFLAPYTASSSDVDTLSWNVGLPEKNEKFVYENYPEIRVSRKLK